MLSRSSSTSVSLAIVEIIFFNKKREITPCFTFHPKPPGSLTPRKTQNQIPGTNIPTRLYLQEIKRRKTKKAFNPLNPWAPLLQVFELKFFSPRHEISPQSLGVKIQSFECVPLFTHRNFCLPVQRVLGGLQFGTVHRNPHGIDTVDGD